MNVIQMKRLSCQKNRNSSLEKKENPLEKVTSATRLSVGDESDATSIVSTDDDFKSIPDPLRLSDICLPIPTSVNGSNLTPHLSVRTPHTNKNPTDDSMKTSASSFVSEAPPLIVPDYVQHLKLKPRRSTGSELSSSISVEIQSCQTSSEAPTSDRAPGPVGRQASPTQLSPSSKKVSERTDEFKPKSQSAINDGQIEIGQVVSSTLTQCRQTELGLTLNQVSPLF